MNKEFIEAVKELIEDLDQVTIDAIEVFSVAYVHGCKYTGRTYTDSLNKVKELLAKYEENLNTPN